LEGGPLKARKRGVMDTDHLRRELCFRETRRLNLQHHFSCSLESFGRVTEWPHGLDAAHLIEDSGGKIPVFNASRAGKCPPGCCHQFGGMCRRSGLARGCHSL
jgi:hypothetical protein